MNIFYVDNSPKVSAQMLCDKHVVKQSLEATQMLANCFSEETLAHQDTPKTQKGTVRKYSHWKHPSSLWVRESKENMKWLLTHAKELCYEKKRRYPAKPLPFVYGFLEWCETNLDLSTIPSGKLTSPPQCMPDYCKIGDNTVEAYRNYYIQEKSNIATWKQDKTPNWFKIV